LADALNQVIFVIHCIYSIIEYLVKIAPCYFCFEHTTTLSLLGKVIQFMSSELH